MNIESRILARALVLVCSMPGLYRKKCKACQHDNHFNSNKCKRCGGALDIQDQGGILPVRAMVGL